MRPRPRIPRALRGEIDSASPRSSFAQSCSDPTTDLLGVDQLSGTIGDSPRTTRKLGDAKRFRIHVIGLLIEAIEQELRDASAILDR